MVRELLELPDDALGHVHACPRPLRLTDQIPRHCSRVRATAAAEGKGLVEVLASVSFLVRLHRTDVVAHFFGCAWYTLRTSTPLPWTGCQLWLLATPAPSMAEAT
jgi:hypothetical protein